MIKNEELRLGNYILADGKIGYVSTIFPWFIQVNDNTRVEHSISHDDEIMPIPLTEAVLMAAGFERENYGWYLKGEGKKYGHDDMGLFDYSRGKCNDLRLNASACPCPKIESLHYLQNLFYYLHGKELEINMEELKKAVNG